MPLLARFQIHGLICSLIVVTHLSLYTYVILNIPYSIYIILLVYMFSEMIFHIEQPVGVLFPGEDHFYHWLHSMVTCSPLHRVEASRNFLSTLKCLLILLLFRLCIGSHVGETVCVQVLRFLEDTISRQTPLFSDSYGYLFILFWNSIAILKDIFEFLTVILLYPR